MPILAYCVCLPSNDVSPEKTQWFEIQGLRCYYGEVKDFSVNAGAGVQIALDFHNFNSRLFQTREILPFRFPTISPTVEELRTAVAAQSERLITALKKMTGTAQMEVTLSQDRGTSPKMTGTDYLKQAGAHEAALNLARERIQNAAQPWAQKWKIRPCRSGLRLFALVKRGSQQAFSQALGAVPLSDGVKCTVTGPWPATEFVDE
jgi:hypothetical protein